MKRINAFLLAALCQVCAFAADGQILINQATVMAAGGFPYVISQPGSYKLSSNLVNATQTDGVVVAASNVVLDLNGFTLSTTANDRGILSYAITSPSGATRVTVRNGQIAGSWFPIGNISGLGLSLWTLQDLVLIDDSYIEYPTTLGNFVRIVNITAPTTDIKVVCPSVVTGSTVRSVFAVGGVGTCSFTNNAVVSP